MGVINGAILNRLSITAIAAGRGTAMAKVLVVTGEVAVLGQ
jgi:hypothetical protein